MTILNTRKIVKKEYPVGLIENGKINPKPGFFTFSNDIPSWIISGLDNYPLEITQALFSLKVSYRNF